jgi:exo-beta-1,3-glucanase (GH17 family)
MFRRPALLSVLALLSALDVSGVRAAPACGRHEAAAASLRRLSVAMAQGRFVAYQPTQIQLVDGRASRADAGGIRADLQALRPRFDALVTYGAGNGADQVADIAAQLNFRAVILGIWSINDEAEIALALAAAARHPQLVVGLSLGNERVLAGETTFPALAKRIEQLRRRAPTLAFTTTEPFHLYGQDAASPLLATADFLLVNVHPIFQPWFAGASQEDAARFVVNVMNDLAGRYCGPALVKETGVPTAPAASGYTPARQAGFYRALRAQFPPTGKRAFAYFSAFDAPWRVNDAHPTPGAQPQEGSWGLYDAARRPKPAALEVPEIARREPALR